MPIKSREIHLKSRPVGLPSPDNFALVDVTLPDPQPGQVLVRNHFMSVDPYMRGRMYDRPSYVPPFPLGAPLEGGSVGEVVASRHPDFSPGEMVLSRLGWREYFLSDGSGLTKIDTRLVPPQAYLGVMGMPGMTAYVGLLDIGKPQPGQTVFVSAAAGAVGQVACQIAKLKGCRVIGSAGSPSKVQWLLEVAGIDAAFNYKTVPSLVDELGRLAPEGIDIYFENVGGAHLEAALEHMKPFGRIVLCGMISQYNAPSPGPRNLVHAVRKRLLLQGFIVSDHLERQAPFHADMAAWIREGKVKWEETIVEGLEKAPQAFIGLFHGENLGKMLVKLV
ncbi:MAG: NADP-dependent oxidoreductase [Candidatus Tectimicrobiota bacterium]|nr:MAG: NADP-dependent oxidoreductase [Candidatus Tectomicrobia bacterium]